MSKGYTVRDFRNKQFFQVDDVYLNGYAKVCGWGATLVYMALCRHASKDQKCFPSQKVMATKLGISRRTVWTALQTLVDWNIIAFEPQERKDSGAFKNNTYILLDKGNWNDLKSVQTTPFATGAVGTTCERPFARGASDRSHVVLNKDTHIKDTHIKDTHIKDTHMKPVFVKPTIEEIKVLIKAESLDVHPDKFFSYYESIGWMVGKNKMKCWKSAIRGWSVRNNGISVKKVNSRNKLGEI